MIIGSVKEIKRHEYRVGLTPACVATYTYHGHVEATSLLKLNTEYV